MQYADLKTYLADLRQHAVEITGSAKSADAHVRAALQAFLEDDVVVSDGLEVCNRITDIFHAIWSTTSGRLQVVPMEVRDEAFAIWPTHHAAPEMWAAQ